MAMTGEAGRTWQRRNGITPAPETGSAVPPAMRELLLVPEALAALPAKVREMVRLRFLENRTYDEIAAEVGVSAFYVKAAVKKAEATLRRIARSRGK
jgi:DNA-directed RNA polymerase specialized sigma24 family protein